jgi:GNAT superfamily N-acetyltransferase
VHAEGQTSAAPADAPASPIRVAVNPTLTGPLRSHLVEMWARVTNEGGSVVFVPPVTAADVRPTADRSFARVVAGSDVLVCLVAPETADGVASTLITKDPGKNAGNEEKTDPAGSLQDRENGQPGGRGTTTGYLPATAGSELATGEQVVAWLLLAESESHLRRHWRTVYRVQVDPTRQGAGLGRSLMAAAARYAQDSLGLEALTLMTRSGTGAERFYKRCGYREVGRIPGAMRVGPGDDRDEVHFWLDLNPTS